LRRLLVLAALLFFGGAAASADEWSATTPPIDETHIASGEINRTGEAVGYHHRFDGIDAKDARVLAVIAPPDAHGIYRARVAVHDPLSGTWIEKRDPSTFFPDRMADPSVDQAILHAYLLGRRRADGRFIGPSGDGFEIEGWYERGRILSAYPLRRGR
jgi:Bacterial EndoU nuclease